MLLAGLILLGVVGAMGLRWYADSQGIGLGEFAGTLASLFLVSVGVVTVVGLAILGVLQICGWIAGWIK